MFQLLTQLFAASKNYARRRDSRRARLAVENLEAREVMTASIIGAGIGTHYPVNWINPAQGWIDQNLHDPAIHFLVTGYDNDRVLSRNDMLAILNTVTNDAFQNGGVTDTELSDLRALVSNPGIVGMPGYVANLANKVVNFDPADVNYQGNVLESGPTGLRAGDSGQMLTKLTDKWFLGMDHPTLPDRLDDKEQIIPGSSSAFHYQLAAGTLFGAGPGYSDVMQGGVSDCYLMAALEVTALQRPSMITNMFINNGDGTYTVRFYNNGTPDYVTVDRYLPANANGYFFAANEGRKLNDPTNKLWVALAEKAYAQLDESGWTQRDGGGSQQVNSYNGLDFGQPSKTLPQITGRSSFTPLSDHGFPATTQSLINDFKHGALICLFTDSNAKHVDPTVVPSHVYAMISYFTSSGGLLVLDNPWTPAATSKPQTLVQSWEKFLQMGFVGLTEVSFGITTTNPPPSTVTQSVGAATTTLATNIPADINNAITTGPDRIVAFAGQLPMVDAGLPEVHGRLASFDDLRRKTDHEPPALADIITALFADKDADRLGAI